MGAVKEEINEVSKPGRGLGARHIQLLLIFLGLFLVHCTRTIMSLAIVDMTNPAKDNSFNWTIQRQSVILSSFSWGYVIPQVIAGELVVKYTGMVFLITCVGMNSLISLILPVAAIHGDWIMVCFCRGVQGLAQGSIFPTVLYLLGKWVPLSERGRLSSLVLSGCYLGIATQMIVSGYIANYWGWEMIFYVNGIAGIVWTIIYFFIGSDNPQNCKLISTDERYYIQTSLGQIGGHKKIKTPWKSILTSLPFYAILAVNVGYSWGYWTLLTEIPTYLSKALKVDIKSNGVMSSLPYLTMFAMNFPIGFASDYIISKQWVSLTVCRKIINSFGFFGTALSLYCLTYIPSGNAVMAVAALCVASFFNSGYYGGFMLVFLDMAQNFSSILIGISNFTANLLGLFAPLLAGFILKDENNPEEWLTVFYISSITYVVTNIFFLIFGTSKEQKWNKEISINKI